MDTAIKWGLIGVFVLFLLIGFLVGLIRGIKRSGIHLGFIILSVILAFLLTKVITNAVLGIKINIGGSRTTISQYILNMIEKSFDISKFKSISDFATNIPRAVASPVVFMAIEAVICGLFEIIYLVVARVSFGSKKEDFKKHKPRRLLGALVGTIEGFLLMFLTFAPITSLTLTAEALIQEPQATSSASIIEDGKLKTINEFAKDMIPENVTKYMGMFNDSVLTKVVSFGGVNNLFFDGLSNTKINGEKIYFRKDLAACADAYNKFTYVYNSVVVDKNYEISVGKFLDSAEKVIDSGIFKAVITETIRDVVVNYDELKVDYPMIDKQLIGEIVERLQPKFERASFDVQKYIKHDALLLMDVTDNVFKDRLVKKISDLDPLNASIEEILEFIVDNEGIVRNNFSKVSKLNVVDDNFDLVIDVLSGVIDKNIKQDATIDVELNKNASIKTTFIDDVVTIAKNIYNLNEDLKTDGLSLTKLTEGDPIKNLGKISNVGNILTKIGDTLDTARNMDIFVLPIEEGVRDEKVYVVDNILKRYGVELLGDEVYGYNENDETTTKLDSYTKLMTYIKGPVSRVQGIQINMGEGVDPIGLLEAVTMDLPPIANIINSIIDEIAEDPQIFNEIVLPFHEISTTSPSIKEKIFDKVIGVLKDGTNNLLNFEDLEGENDTYAKWKQQLTYMGNAMKYLHAGDIEESGSHYTCFEYILANGFESDKLFKELLENQIEGKSQFARVMENVFASSVCKNLTNTLFEKIDEAIEDATSKNPTTDVALLQTDENAIDVLESLLNIILDADDLGFEEVGQVLDALKENAAENGVFENIFNDLIWFATGDTMGDFSGTPTNDYYKDVKAIINPTENTDVYYTINYQEKFTEIDSAVDLAQDMKDAVEGISIKDNPEQFMNAINGVFSGYEEEDLLEILDDLNTIIEADSAREVVDTSSLTEEEKALAEQKIDETFSDEVAARLKSILGLN